MYATADDLDSRITQSELIRLTDEDDLGVVNSEKIASALVAADTEIDSYLSVRYALPISSPQLLLTSLAIDITIWNLYALDGSGAPKERRERYQNALRALERIRDGDPPLDIPTIGNGASTAAYFGPERLFSRNTMKGL